MNLLQVIKQELEANPRVVVAGIAENNYFPYVKAGFTHTVNFIVAPDLGMRDPVQLQQFMERLVTPTPFQKDNFRIIDNVLHFGKLYFDEVILYEEIAGLATGKKIRKYDAYSGYVRRTRISVYPYVNYAKAVMEGTANSYKMVFGQQPKASLLRRMFKRA